MYQTINHSLVRRLSDGAVIPFDAGNTDYQTYLVWLDAGNVAQPAPQPSKAELAKAGLAALEQGTMMNKGMREFFMVSMQDMAIRKAAQMIEAGEMNGTPVSITPQEILAHTPAWVRLLEINAQAVALEKEAGL